MKKIEAVIRHFKLDEVKQSLVDQGFTAMTVAEVKGFGRQRGHQELYRGSEYDVDFIPKIKIEVVVTDERLQSALDAVISAGHTGQVGDGKIFVTDIGDAIRIRTSQRGDVAL